MTDCPEIRNRLSEYLDDALDAKAKALAEEHLLACPDCREELDSLKALLKGLGSIKPVQAPADFLDQLHRRMERPSALSRMRDRFFYPLRVKIPLQLAGAAVTALILFSILPLQQSSIKMSTKPDQEKKDTAYYKDEAAGMIQPAERPEALVQKGSIPGPGKAIREVALNLKRQVRAKAASAETTAAPTAASPALMETQRQKLAARTPAHQEDKKEEALKKEADSDLSITKAIESAKGKVLSVEYNPQTGWPESVQAEVPAGQISLFYEKLKELGELTVSPETRAEKDSGLVTIKIRVIGLQ